MADSGWVIRIEGVNLGETVFSVPDLSTMRGASLTLETFGEELFDLLETAGLNLQDAIVYRGASQMAIDCAGKSGAFVEALCDKIRVRLASPYRHPPERPPALESDVLEAARREGSAQLLERFRQVPSEHLTFVVDAASYESGDVDGAVRLAQLRSRRRQMRAPNMPRSPGQSRDALAPTRSLLQCPIDDRRQIDLGDPNHASIWVNADRYDKAIALENDGALKRIAVSKRVGDLRAYGRDARQKIYALSFVEAKEKGRDPTSGVLDDWRRLTSERGLFGRYHFAESFDDLVEDPPDALRISLFGKIAFLYFDGIGFTDARARLGLRTFSTALNAVAQRHMVRLLDAWLDGAEDPSLSKAWIIERFSRRSGQSRMESFLRVETLISGGDEFCIVMPAWLAWEMSERILAWLEQEGHPHGLAYRAGLLICPRKSPVRRAFAFAEKLCTDAKRLYGGGTPRPCLSFHVIEGADVPDLRDGSEASLFEARGTAYRGSASRSDPADETCKLAAAFRWDLEELRAYRERMALLKRDLPKSQLHRLIPLMDQPSERQNSDLLDAALKELEFRSSSPLDADQIMRAIPGHASVPLSLRMKVVADLWDYVDPFGPTEAER